MTRLRERNESGAALVLTIVVLVVIGGLSASLMASLTTGFKGRAALDQVRNREYAADGAVEYAVTQVRQLASPGAGNAACGPTLASGATGYIHTLNGISIEVDCTNRHDITTALLLERDVAFTACLNTGHSCTNSSSIINASVNFTTASAASSTVTRTYVQSWSVNA
jgi:type II secretory pathway pseudopilin PulG